MLRFERMLKESLLEGFITSTTLEKITRELNLVNIRNLKIPETPTIEKVFGEKSQISPIKEEIIEPKSVEPSIESPQVTPSPPISSTPTTEPTTPPVSSTPQTPLPADQEPTTVPERQPTQVPKISFSLPDTPETPKPDPLAPKPPEKQAITPSIPKISFPTATSSTPEPPSSPLARFESRREEDRATGIAILRKQMLTELKKIRSVVSEEEK